ncbi:MAG: EAL domain-containing protein [Deltaproteobacteria bacterium]|nr:EAL domain-containing protein [Deltaproteobacteria bacterium]
MKKTSKKIFVEQVRLLYVNSMVPIVVSVVIGAALCWSQWSYVNTTALIVWFALFLTISVVRICLLFRFGQEKAEPGYESMKRWHDRFLIGTYAVAVLWGSVSFFLFPDGQSHQMVLFLILVGMAGGAVSSLCSSLPAVSGFLSLMLIPLVFKMVTLGSGNTMFLGVLILLFWVVTLSGAFKINANIRENIQLRLQSIEREKVIKVNEERYRHIISNAPLGIFQFDNEGAIVDCNDAFVKIIGSSMEKLIGLHMPATLKERGMLGAVNDSLTTGDGYFEGDYSSVTSNKTSFVRVFLKAIRSSDQVIIGGVGIVEDLTEKKLSEQQIQYHTTYDSLTGLPNRRLLLDHLRNEMSRARRYDHYGALLFIDLDNFKTVNDSLGHWVGDELLKLVSDRITGSIRQEDSAARMGGDEFIIILTELDEDLERAADKAREIAEEISYCISCPCKIEGQEMCVTPSIGVSLFPKPGISSDDILKQADTAMYRAKAAGRNEIRFFLPSMQQAADEQLRLYIEIRKALDNDEFAVYYQPQVDIAGRITGAEALLRWHHPERGLIPPDDFLPVAEETGIMWDIGRWVLRSACRHIKIWADAGQLGESHIISVNISSKEFVSSDFVETVMSILDETGARPDHLGIELTESSFISTGKDIVEKITTLQQLGVKFSVDDFGTGYSSLSYLKSLPLNTLKIDRSFVSDIRDAGNDIVLVDTIIMMAQNLGLEIIAEGVETEQELLYLSTRGCFVYQGYYFSKPVPVTDFSRMLEAKNCNTAG